MTSELDDKLLNRFKFYRIGKDVPINISLWYGFECGPGWFKLLWELSESIEKELEKMPKEWVDSFGINEVKEKYGVLIVYTSKSHSIIDKLIDEAEHKSEEICEECGEKGEIRGFDWVQTLCDSCYEKSKLKRE